MKDNFDSILQITLHTKINSELIEEIILSEPHLLGFRNSPFPIPKERKRPLLSHLFPLKPLNSEVKFKTLLALLLSQEELFSYFLCSNERKNNFRAAIEKIAGRLELGNFFWPEEEEPHLIAKALTTPFGCKKSLLEEKRKLYRNLHAIKKNERAQLLFELLEMIDRPDLTSELLIECKSSDPHRIGLKTCYGRYEVKGVLADGKIDVQSKREAITPSTGYLRCTSVKNLRSTIDLGTNEKIASYSGEISTIHNALEVLLFLLGNEGDCDYYLSENEPSMPIIEKEIFFTSLYSWNELTMIHAEKSALDALDDHYLLCYDAKGNKRAYHLKLRYLNFAFNALNHFPKPEEIEATIDEITLEGKIFLLAATARKLNLSSPILFSIEERIARAKKEKDFFTKKRRLIEALNDFKSSEEELLAHFYMKKNHNSPLISAIDRLFSKGSKATALINLCYILSELKLDHHINCKRGIDRTGALSALNKAQRAFSSFTETPFLPGYDHEENEPLFSLLYSLYLIWEESEINSALASGFSGERFHKNPFKRNREATFYLTPWIKKHPESYLGISSER